MLTILRDEGESVAHLHEAAALPGLLADTTRPFWLDLESPTADELTLLSDVFHFHPLAVEDATHLRQRPKLDEYDGFFFLTADEVTLTLLDSGPMDGGLTGAPPGEDGDDVQARQIAVFLGANYLVTVHAEPIRVIQTLRDRCERNHRLLDHGADYLLYTLLDAIVDDYFPLLDTLDTSVDDLEDRVVGRPQAGILEAIFRLKRDLTRLRRYASPLREVLQSLTARDFPHIQERTLPYLRDVADHLFRVTETLDSYRDLMSNMLDAHLSQVSNEMNRVMQKLSVVATVFLPITFITGVFGMNFAKQPWLNTDFWFWAFVMLAIAMFTYWWFHRRHWV
jgi:magnesium transporter